MRIVAWLVLLGGCDFTWNLDRIDGVDADVGDGGRDGGFDPEFDCPPTYDLALFAGSRYRITDNSFAWWDSYDDCTDDTAAGNPQESVTHLAVADSEAEQTALRGSLIAKQQGRWWIGAVQPAAGVSLPLDGWLWLTGEAVSATHWSRDPLEPNDGDGLENDHAEQFAFIDEMREGLVDIDGAFGNRALCECDGRHVSDDALTAISQSRP